MQFSPAEGLLSHFDTADHAGANLFSPDNAQLGDPMWRMFDSSSSNDDAEAAPSDASRSSGRGSESTPYSKLHNDATQSAQNCGASWVHIMPQFASVQAVTPAAVPAAASSALQPVTSTWHPAFYAPEGTQQQPAKEPKIAVSHSTIEKQRRDRINSLIDELRDLVPPIASMRGPDGGDAKRPKHVVLSDTISLLRQLKSKVQHDELERQRLQMLKQQLAATSLALPDAAAAGPATATVMTPGGPVVMVPFESGLATDTGDYWTQASTLAAAGAAGAGPSAQSLLQHSLSGSMSSQTVAAATAAVLGSSCPELPQAPPNLPSAVGVVVEETPGSFLVKVNCKDRHGLLSDITQALGNLPLQVTRAAITTSNGGAVYDVFEIVVEQSAEHEQVTALDLQYHVHQALHKWKTANPAAAAAADEAAGGIPIGKRKKL